MRAYILPAARGFSPLEFSRLRELDPLGDTDRYQDICGKDIGEIMSWLDWSFLSEPQTISLVSEIGDPLATGFVAPLRHLKKPTVDGWHGVNLSYAVNSQYEGHGFGLAASCLAILEAESMWGSRLGKDAFLNIQTRSLNGRSNSLIRHLTGHTEFDVADFLAKLSNGQCINFSGARIPWQQAVAIAERHLLSMPFLVEMPLEETENFEPLPMG